MAALKGRIDLSLESCKLFGHGGMQNCLVALEKAEQLKKKLLQIRKHFWKLRDQADVPVKDRLRIFENLDKCSP